MGSDPPDPVWGWLLNHKQTFRDGNLAGSIETFLSCGNATDLAALALCSCSGVLRGCVSRLVWPGEKWDSENGLPLLLLAPHFMLIVCVVVSQLCGHPPQGSRCFNTQFVCAVLLVFILPLPALLGTLLAFVILNRARLSL